MQQCLIDILKQTLYIWHWQLLVICYTTALEITTKTATQEPMKPLNFHHAAPEKSRLDTSDSWQQIMLTQITYFLQIPGLADYGDTQATNTINLNI